MQCFLQNMMRGILTFVIGFIFASEAFSQSLQVIDTKFSHNMEIGDEVRTVVKLKNISDHPIHVMVRRDEMQIGSSQNSYFCWDNDCLESEGSLLPTSHLIQPGEIVETFVSILTAGLDETISNLKYTFFDRENPDDEVIVELDYTVKDKNNGSFMFNSNSISLSDIYPNPVSDVAYISYLIYDEEIEAKIVFHNVLGSGVGEYTLNPVEQELKIITTEFKPGVYFYTLYVDNEGKVTKKLIIKK